MRKRFLLPSFLKQFDTWLLKHKPAVWSARTHLLLYYTLAFSAVLTLFAFVSFTDARLRSHADVWSGFTGLAAFTAFVFWLIFLLRFNVFKRFGNWKKWEGLRMFGLYFINIAALVFTAFIPYIVECVKANRAYNNQELVSDMNEMNLAMCQLDYNILPKKFSVDTIELVKTDTALKDIPAPEEIAATADSIIAAEEAAVEYRPNYTYVYDTVDFKCRVNNADSLKKLTDSVYVIFECPGYVFASSYYAGEYSTVSKLSSFEIYNRVIKHHRSPDRPALLKWMKQMDEKYATDHPEYRDRADKSYSDIIEEKYNIREINRSIEQIAQKKYWWKNNKTDLTRIFWYTTLVVTLLVFIFRSTTVKTFFLSLLAGVVLLTGTAIMIGVFDISDEGIFTFILVYYCIFFITALTTKAAKVRTALQGIALNFTVALTVFIPITAVNLFFELLENDNYDHRYDHLLYEMRPLYGFYAEIAGIVLLLVLLEPLFRKLYKRWYALPEE